MDEQILSQLLPEYYTNEDVTESLSIRNNSNDYFTEAFEKAQPEEEPFFFFGE